jgi:hypothetical protein
MSVLTPTTDITQQRCFTAQRAGASKDRMMRTPDGEFYLIEGPGRPGEPEVVTPYSLQAVYNWLQDLPWQIERAVVSCR